MKPHLPSVSHVLIAVAVIGTAVLLIASGLPVVAEDDGNGDTIFEVSVNNTGEAHSIGFPAETNATLAEMFVNGTDGVGAVYAFEDGSWIHVTALDEIEPGPRDAFVLSTTGEGPNTIDLRVVFTEFEGGTGMPDIERPVDAGWNFISAADCEPAESSFLANPLDEDDPSLLVLDRFPGPAPDDRPTPDIFDYYVMGSYEWGAENPAVDAFTGYFAYYEESADVLKVEDPETLC